MHWGLRRSPKSLVLSYLRVCYSVRYKKIILLRSYYKRLSCDFFLFLFDFRVDICGDCGILFAVMRDKNMKTKMVKLRGPNGTTREITAEEWASYTPLNALANARIAASRVEEKYSQEREDAFNGGYDDLAGHCDGPED